jgi:hypothetical protein
VPNSGGLIDLGEVLGSVAPVPSGSHVAVCLTGSPLRRKIQAAFLAEGLRDWLCVYAAQDEPLVQVRAELRTEGLPEDAHFRAVRWMTGQQLYGDPTHPDLSLWTSSIHHLFDEVRRLQLRGLRWTGDLPIAFARRGLYDRLRELEESVAEHFPGPYTILCTYEEVPSDSPRPLLQAFAAHSRTYRPGRSVATSAVRRPAAV